MLNIYLLRKEQDFGKTSRNGYEENYGMKSVYEGMI